MAGSYEIYLIRHGVAEERGDAWPDDAKRPLTRDGMRRLRKSATGLVRLGVSFDVLLTSPLLRARQTAEVVGAAFSSRPPIVALQSLIPDGSCSAVLADLARQAHRRRIALVGHEPSLGEIAAHLIGARNPMAFRKGAVCRIDVDALPPTGPGSLCWFVTSKILRAVRK